jgi:hypothetical protein
MTATLTQFKNDDGIEIYIDTTTGESFASIRGYARMSGRDESTIRERISKLKDAGETTVKTAEVQTGGGLQGARLVSEKLIAQWLPKDNPEVASKLMELGVRHFLHVMAGYEVTSTAVPKSPAEALLEMCQLMVEHERKLKEQEEQIKQIIHTQEAQDLEIQANAMELERFRNGHGYYYSIAGWCNNIGIKPSLQWMNTQGRKAAALCKARKITPEKVADPRWGQVNTYPDSVLAEMEWTV